MQQEEKYDDQEYDSKENIGKEEDEAKGKNERKKRRGRGRSRSRKIT